MYFKDRKEAGIKLAAALAEYKKAPKTMAVGLPRGGVVVAAEAAKILEIPLDVVIPRKIGAPQNEELAIGALAGDVLLLNFALIRSLGIARSAVDPIAAKEKKEAERRSRLYRKGRADPHFEGWTVIVIDDGAATGYTMRASIAFLRQKKAARIIAALPVAPPDTVAELQKEADRVICLTSPDNFMAVGQFYRHFEQIEDSEVIELLRGIS